MLVALAVTLAACAREGERDMRRLPVVLSASFPVRLLTADGTELSFPAPPRRVLPANAAWVDYLTLLTGPERVCALPAAAFGYSRLAPDPGPWAALPRFSGLQAEALLALEPDLVLAHAWQDPETLATLRRAEIGLLALPVPESWDEVEETLVLLATVLGERARVAEIAADHAARRAALRARASGFAGLRALCYTNLGAGGWTAGLGTTAHVLLELAGLRDAAAEAGIRGEASVEIETLLSLAPDLFVVGLPDRTESQPPSADVLTGEPALAGLEAIRARRIVALPAALFSSASPELLRGAERLVEELERLF